MIYLVLAVTGIAVAGATLWAYLKVRTAMNPLTFLAPMILYLHVARPWYIIAHDGYSLLFPRQGPLLTAALVHLIGISLFCFAIVRGLNTKGKDAKDLPRVVPTPQTRGRLLLSVPFYTALGYASFFIGLYAAGGFGRAYSQAYGGGGTSIGYLNAMIHALFVAAAVFLLARQDKRLGWIGFAILVVIIFPQILHSILGARRGPVYHCLVTLLLGHVLITPRRIPFWVMVTVITFIGAFMIALVSHRALIYLGADVQIDPLRAFQQAFPSQQATRSDEYTTDAGAIYMAQTHKRYFGGWRIPSYFVVRMIPRFLWPTKWEDSGLWWCASALTYTDVGFTIPEWEQTLGWHPSLGCPVSIYVDLFLELSWFGLLLCYPYGYFIGFLWRKAMRRGGFWSVVNFLAVLVYPFLVSQSLEAFVYRFLIMLGLFVPLWFLAIRGTTTFRVSPVLLRRLPLPRSS